MCYLLAKKKRFEKYSCVQWAQEGKKLCNILLCVVVEYLPSLELILADLGCPRSPLLLGYQLKVHVLRLHG